jgi:Putative translation initiation inhibitor, yjgF family
MAKAGKTAIGGDIMVGGIHKMPLSKAVRAGDWVFVSGITAIDKSGQVLNAGIEEQTRHVLQTIRGVLESAGCEMSDVVKATVWLEDPRDFWSFNRVYAEFFPSDPPARSTLQSGLMLDCKVEIEVLAYKPL